MPHNYLLNRVKIDEVDYFCAPFCYDGVHVGKKKVGSNHTINLAAFGLYLSVFKIFAFP